MLKTDWYDEGYAYVIKGLTSIASISEDAAIEAYTYLTELGLIDYDIEKEVFFGLIVGEDEDD